MDGTSPPRSVYIADLEERIQSDRPAKRPRLANGMTTARAATSSSSSGPTPPQPSRPWLPNRPSAPSTSSDDQIEAEVQALFHSIQLVERADDAVLCKAIDNRGNTPVLLQFSSRGNALNRLLHDCMFSAEIKAAGIPTPSIEKAGLPNGVSQACVTCCIHALYYPPDYGSSHRGLGRRQIDSRACALRPYILDRLITECLGHMHSVGRPCWTPAFCGLHTRLTEA